jgi:hypothetical protein
MITNYNLVAKNKKFNFRDNNKENIIDRSHDKFISLVYLNEIILIFNYKNFQDIIRHLLSKPII